jgi:hypothetical protein
MRAAILGAASAIALALACAPIAEAQTIIGGGGSFNGVAGNGVTVTGQNAGTHCTGVAFICIPDTQAPNAGGFGFVDNSHLTALPASTGYFSVAVQTLYAGTANAGSELAGAVFAPTVQVTGGTPFGFLVGNEDEPSGGSSGTYTEIDGHDIALGCLSTATCNLMEGLYISLNNSSSVAVGEWDALYIDALQGTGPKPTVRRGIYEPATDQPNQLASEIVSLGPHQNVGGSCAAASQTGGVFAGTFLASGACVSGTFILAFTNAAPTGWGCTLQDLTTPTDVFHETAYDTTHATFTGSAANNDRLVFSGCTGF